MALDSKSYQSEIGLMILESKIIYTVNGNNSAEVENTSIDYLNFKSDSQ